MSQSKTKSTSYTETDISKVVNRVRADLIMIADSTGTWSGEHTREVIHDIECLAQSGYLRQFDLTLLSADEEIKAVKYVVVTDSGSFSMSRPGGAMWPRVESAKLRIILSYNNEYNRAAREKMSKKLKRKWSASNDDISHATLKSTPGRDYASNGYEIQRTDWSS